jgi:ketosteroid isomerase-like protein
MNAIKRVMIIAACLAAAAACAPPTANTAADEAALRGGTDTWVKAYNAADADTIVALYADDAIVMPPGAPPAKGHSAIRDWLLKDISASQSAGVSLVLGDAETGFSGELGWHSGVFTARDKSGATVDTGKYCEVWRRSSGKWQMLRDIWNSDVPPPAAAPAAAPAAEAVKN